VALVGPADRAEVGALLLLLLLVLTARAPLDLSVVTEGRFRLEGEWRLMFL